MTLTPEARRNTFKAIRDGKLTGSQLLAFYAAENMQLFLMPDGVEKMDTPPLMDKVLDALDDARKAVRNGQAFDFKNVPRTLIENVHTAASLAYQHERMRMPHPVFVMTLPRGYLHDEVGPWMAVAVDTDGDALPDLLVLVALQNAGPENVASVPVLAARLRKGPKGAEGPDFNPVATVAGKFPFGSDDQRIGLTTALVRVVLSGLFVMDAAPRRAFALDNRLNALNDVFADQRFHIPIPLMMRATDPKAIETSAMERAALLEGARRANAKLH